MQKEITIKYEEVEDIQQLQETDRKLLEAATAAAQSAYAPYSLFKVGAAILLENGTIVKGNNQENLAYPSGLCAERVAVFSASANHPKEKIKAIAITAISDTAPTDKPVAPCGACRQALIEYEIRDKEDIRCILRGSTGKIFIFNSMHDMLPLQDNFLNK